MASLLAPSPGKAQRPRRASLLRNLGFAASLLACAFSMGLQWPALQVAAWTKMAVGNWAREGWRAAVIEAVEGPKCPICNVIAAAEQQSRKEHDPATANGDESRFVMSLPPSADAMPKPATVSRQFPTETARPVFRRDEPLIPPPRANVG